MDLYQIANHILPTIAKQEHTLGLAFSSNDATLMKFQKEILRDGEVILISKKKDGVDGITDFDSMDNSGFEQIWR